MTIEGFRSAINSVWITVDRTLAENFYIQKLIKSFRIERPRSMIVYPKWDLALVLRVLSRAPFHPVEQANPKDLTIKTAFLLLLASGRRCGEVHAIDPKRINITKDGDAILEPRPGFLPKTLACAEGEKRYSPIVIRRLSHITDDLDEMALCPVRALLAYHAYASRRDPSRTRFWISTQVSAREVCKNTMSGWVTAFIRRAHKSANNQDAALASRCVHEIRAQATTLAFQATFALEKVLEAATWATPTTFISYYVREMSDTQSKIHSIGPCVVAGTKLH